MAIRNSAKAILLDGNGHILLNQERSEFGISYGLPGGGQRQYETLEQTVVRECLEETGYTVKPIRLSAVYEEIWGGQSVRERYGDYAHKIYFVFLCALDSQKRAIPVEPDLWQQTSQWITLDKMLKNPFHPAAVLDHLQEMLHSQHTIYLGSHCTQWGPEMGVEEDENLSK